MSALLTKTKTGFAAVDSDPERQALVAFLQEATHERAVRAYKDASIDQLALTPGAHALDVGCGLGDDALAMAALVGPGGSVVGVDTSELMLANARARARALDLPVQFRAGSAYALGFVDAAFDAVRADRVFHFLEQPQLALAELVRVTRPGGRLVISEPDHDTLALDTSEPELTERLLDHRRHHAAVPTPGRRLRRLFVDAGLTDVQMVAHAGVVTDFDVADRLLGLTVLGRDAVAAGAWTTAEGLQWRVSAARDSARGRFLAVMTVLTASGRRPAVTSQGGAP